MWLNAPDKFQLQQEEVHVWKADVQQFKTNYSFFFDLLSEDEKERASKFRYDEHRLTYVTGKGLLRCLLANYLSLSPSAILFQYNERSKPFIENSIGLQFNVSHSNEVLLFGFSLHHEVGVDVEYNKRQVEIPQITKRFFSTNEAKTLLSLPENKWLSTFYNCWTRKEAFIKAKGGGLSLPLDQFEVSLLSEEKAELTVIRWKPEDVSNWKMEAFYYKEDYTAAIIVNCARAFFNYYDCSTLILVD